jgi:HEAT repeat protein
LLTLVPDTADAAVSEELAEELQSHVDKHVEGDELHAKRAGLLTWGLIADTEAHDAIAEYKTADDLEVRIAAGVALHMAGDSEAKSFLVDQLTGESEVFPILRDQIRVLPNETERELVELLIEKGDAPHRRAAFRYLSTRYGSLFDLLAEYATDSNADLREPAIEALRASGREKALEVAESKLLSSGDADLQKAGLEMVIDISRLPGRAPSAIEVLQGAVDHDNDEIAQRASVRLLEMHDKSGVDRLLSLLGELDDKKRRLEIADALLAHDIAPETKQVKKLREGTDDEQLNDKLLELLVASGDDETFDKIKKKFDSTNFDERLVAARAMGASDDDEALEMLGEALFEGNDDMRLAAARALRQLGDAQALEPLKRAISEERNQKVKIEVIRALGAIGSEQALQILRFNSRTRQPKIKEAIVEAVREAGKKKGADTLNMFFGGRDLDIQWKAFVAALDVAPDVAMERVEQAFRNPPQTFMSDLESLPMSRQKRLLEVLLVHENDRVREAAVEQARRIGEPLFEMYRELVGSEETPESTRLALLRRLAAAGNDKDVALLERVVRETEADSDLAQFAAWTLADHATDDMEATFRGYLSGDETVLSAIGAYGLARMSQ